MAFDVAIETASGRQFMDFHAAQNLCENSGLMFAQPLCEGSLSECLDFPVEFETTLPARLGLPPPAPRAGAAQAGKVSLRGLFKRKIAAFSEKRYQNGDWKRGRSGGAGCAGGGGALTLEELARLEIGALVTEQ